VASSLLVELESAAAELRSHSFPRPKLSRFPLRTGRLPVLDGVRGLAILMVMLHHFTPDHGAGILSVLHLGWVGVDLFFVLSGFLITGILFDAKGSANYFQNFYARRGLRIFPLYYGILLLILFALPLLQWLDVIHVPGLDQVRVWQPWLWLHSSNLLLAWKGQWMLDSGVIRMNHFWSLAVEEHFYLVWPVVVALFDRKSLMKIAAGVIIAALSLRAAFLPSGSTVCARKMYGYSLTIARSTRACRTGSMDTMSFSREFSRNILRFVSSHPLT